MIKIGCNFLSLQNTDVETFIEVAHDLRLDVVDFHHRAFSSTAPEYLGKIKLQCLRYGMPIGYIGVERSVCWECSGTCGTRSRLQRCN